jgi:predicted HD phosphohydrolase
MKCPGQDTKYWKPGDIFEARCPGCDSVVEFFKDDTTRKCHSCGKRFTNPKMDFGCASYCQYASECLGTLPDELLAQRKDLLKERVAIEMKRYFGSDFKRIGHASRVALYAERIARNEGGNMAVILCSAYLHGIGIHEAERKHDSTAPKYQEVEGTEIARKILTTLSAPDEMVDEICYIIGHHKPGENESTNFKAVYDADIIAKIEDQHKEKPYSEEKLEELIQGSFLTQTALLEARRIFLS